MNDRSIYYLKYMKYKSKYLQKKKMESYDILNGGSIQLLYGPHLFYELYLMNNVKKNVHIILFGEAHSPINEKSISGKIPIYNWITEKINGAHKYLLIEEPSEQLSAELNESKESKESKEITGATTLIRLRKNIIEKKQESRTVFIDVRRTTIKNEVAGLCVFTDVFVNKWDTRLSDILPPTDTLHKMLTSYIKYFTTNFSDILLFLSGLKSV